MPDELDARIRSLEAERLRPVPPPPPTPARHHARQLLDHLHAQPAPAEPPAGPGPPDTDGRPH